MFFQDISSAAGEEKKDKEIKALSLQQGFKNLEEFIIQHQDIERIAFIGKQASELFFV